MRFNDISELTFNKTTTSRGKSKNKGLMEILLRGSRNLNFVVVEILKHFYRDLFRNCNNSKIYNLCICRWSMWEGPFEVILKNPI